MMSDNTKKEKYMSIERLYNKGQISIIVPVYNVRDYLEQCITSLLAQTYSNIEIILVNDGSTDGSLEVCKRFENNNKIKIINQSNKGLSGARNAGIQNASGEYLGFVDSDDFVDPCMYQFLVEAIEKDQAEISCCGRYIFTDRVVGERYNSKTTRIFSKSDAMRELLLSGCIDVAAWDKLYRRDLFCDIRYPEGETNEDLAIVYKLFDRCRSIVHCGKTCYYYRQRVGSITKKRFSLSRSLLLEKHLMDMKDYIISHDCGSEEWFRSYYVNCNFPVLLAGIKAEGLDSLESEEVKRRLEIHNSLIHYYLKNKNNSPKNKVIAWMIRLKIYRPYLRIKAGITRIHK